MPWPLEIIVLLGNKKMVHIRFVGINNKKKRAICFIKIGAKTKYICLDNIPSYLSHTHHCLRN